MGCSGNCASCAGCGRSLTLTEKELSVLTHLCQIPFLPVARTMGDPTPIDPEAEDREEMSLILQCLEKKGLISLDFDKPLKGYTCPYPICGSMALTERGHRVAELLEYQGIEV